jgi:hypothetical protein
MNEKPNVTNRLSYQVINFFHLLFLQNDPLKDEMQ